MEEATNSSIEATLKSAREANKVLTDYLIALNNAILARDKYIEFLTASGKFTMAEVHASDSLADNIIATTNKAYSLAPVKELVPPKYQHLFGMHQEPQPVASQPPQQPPPPAKPEETTPDIPPQDVTSDAFDTTGITLKLVYDNQASAAEFSKSTTAAILSWYNTYLTTVINHIRKENMSSYAGEIGITNELLMREGFLEAFKQYTRSFVNQMNVKVRLLLPDGTSSLIIPTVGLV